jgi:integrase
LVAAMDHRYGTLVYVSAYLGSRWEKVSALKPRDLELAGPIGIVHVRGTLPRSDGRISYRPYGKTASARRSLKVPEFLRQALKFHLAGHSNANWVFPAPQGGFLRGDNFRTRSWTPRD